MQFVSLHIRGGVARNRKIIFLKGIFCTIGGNSYFG